MVKAVKLADIAERVGVSVVTVSKALSGQKGVSEEMRARIKELADEMGYTPIHESSTGRRDVAQGHGVPGDSGHRGRCRIRFQTDRHVEEVSL